MCCTGLDRFVRFSGLAILLMLCSSACLAQLELNTDHWGMDFRDFAVPENPRACFDACRAEPRCRAFTFRTAAVAYGRPHCWLKSDVPPARYAQGATSGIVRPEEVAARPPAPEPNTDRRGTDFQDLAVPKSDRGLALDSSLDVSQYIHDSWRVQEGFTWARINSIAQTPDGYLWVGTDAARNVAAGTGLYRFDGDRNIRWEPPSGQQLPSNLISSLLAARDGTLWIGTSNGLASWKDGKLRHFEGFAGFYIFAILEDRSGVVWVSGIGTPTGRLCAIQASSIHCYGEDGKLGIGVTGLYEDRNANLWAAVVNGFWRWKPGPPDFYSMPGALDGIRDFIEGDNGGLLFTTRSGIKRLMNGKIEPYSLPGNLQQLRVMRMLRDRDGGLWLGTWDRGIVHVHQGRTDTYFNSLSGVDIAGLLEDHEGDIWAVTSEGLDRFREPAFKTRPPRVLIDQIEADGKTYDPSNGLRLPSHVRDVAIGYTALTLVAPDKIHFRYKLEGQDPNWREVVNDRRVQYSNLPPGEYHFRVTACNGGGVWNEAGASLDFSIATAYYQTTWFRALCIALLLLLLLTLYQLRLKQLEHQFNATLQAHVDERTRIARELHDTLLQSFQGLMFLIQAARHMLPRRPEDAKQALDEAVPAMEQAITEGRNAIQDLRPAEITQRDLAALLNATGHELAATQEANGHSPNFRVLIEGKQQALSLLQDEVYRISREVIRNAYHHAAASRIEVEIRYDEDQLRVRIRDDGKGIDPKILKAGGRFGHWGLQGMRERAQRMGSRLEFWSELGAGTEVELTVPAAMAYEKHRNRGRFRLFHWTGSDEQHS